MKDINDTSTMDLIPKSCTVCGWVDDKNDLTGNFILTSSGQCHECSEKENERYEKNGRVQHIVSKLIYSKASKADFEVLNHIMIHIVDFDFSNEFKPNHTEIAEKIYKKRSNVSRSFKSLVDNKFIKKLENGNYLIDM